MRTAIHPLVVRRRGKPTSQIARNERAIRWLLRKEASRELTHRKAKIAFLQHDTLDSFLRYYKVFI